MEHYYPKTIGSSPTVVASLDPAQYGSYAVVANVQVRGHSYVQNCSGFGACSTEWTYPKCWIRTEFFSQGSPSGHTVSSTGPATDTNAGSQVLGTNGILKGSPSSYWIQLVCEAVVGGIKGVTSSPRISNYQDELTAIRISTGTHQVFTPRNSFRRPASSHNAGTSARTRAVR